MPFSNETALAQAVSQTPVIVAICVGPALDDWHHYAGGGQPAYVTGLKSELVARGWAVGILTLDMFCVLCCAVCVVLK